MCDLCEHYAVIMWSLCESAPRVSLRLARRLYFLKAYDRFSNTRECEWLVSPQTQLRSFLGKSLVFAASTPLKRGPAPVLTAAHQLQRSLVLRSRPTNEY